MPIARVSIHCIFRACTLRTLTSVCQFVRTCHCVIIDDRTLSLKSTRTLAYFSIERNLVRKSRIEISETILSFVRAIVDYLFISLFDQRVTLFDTIRTVI